MSIWIECARVECVIETQTHTVVQLGATLLGRQVEASSDERATYLRVLLVCTEGLYVHTVQMCT